MHRVQPHCVHVQPSNHVAFHATTVWPPTNLLSVQPSQDFALQENRESLVQPERLPAGVGDQVACSCGGKQDWDVPPIATHCWQWAMPQQTCAPGRFATSRAVAPSVKTRPAQPSPFPASHAGSHPPVQLCAISWATTLARERSPASKVGVTNVRQGFSIPPSAQQVAQLCCYSTWLAVVAQ